MVLNALKKCKLLWDDTNPQNSNVTESQLAQIAEIVDIVPYKKDSQIIRKGENGKVRVIRLIRVLRFREKGILLYTVLVLFHVE